MPETSASWRQTVRPSAPGTKFSLLSEAPGLSKQKQLPRLPGAGLKHLKSCPACPLNNGRSGLITQDCGTAYIPPSVTVPPIEITLFHPFSVCYSKWQSGRAHSFLGFYTTTHSCPLDRGRGGRKSKGNKVLKPLSFPEEAEQLLLPCFFTEQVEKNGLNPKAQLSWGWVG